MAYYLKIFATQADYNAYIATDYPKPNISYIEATNEVMFTNYQPLSISFDSNSYSLTGTEGDTITTNYTVTDDLGNDVTSQAVITFNNAYVTANNGTFSVASGVTAGTYTTTATATYGSLTATATINLTISAAVTSISFDSNSYSLTGTEFDTILEPFIVTDNLGNDVSYQCSYSMSPNDTDLVITDNAGEYYEFDASSVSAGTYTVTVTATYGNLTTTTTVSMNIASAQHDYSQDYLTFEALESGTFTLTINQYLSSYDQTYVAYSTDNGDTWTTTNIDNTNQTITTPTITAGNKVMWKGEGYRISRESTYGSNFSSTGNFNIEGNIMSLLYGDNFEGQTAFPSSNNSKSAFYNLFKSCSKLKSIENLVMPATTLLTQCYYSMFMGCTGLTTIPTNLLPATTMLPNCYDSMFSGCSSLTTVPELPATTLVTGCYYAMFNGCTSLTTVPSNLLPSMTLATSCYANMFSGCTRLTTAPALPATNGGNGSDAYANMFQNCTSLTTAPVLPAMTSTGWYCYHDMFNGCSSLNYIKAMFTITPGANYTNNWVNGVAASGTFTKVASTTFPSGASGIPEGWTVVNDYSKGYLTFEALESGTFSMNIPAGIDSTYMTSVSYSTDNGTTWTTTNIDNTDQTITTPTIAQGNKVLWRGIGNALSKQTSSGNYSYFSSTGRFNVYGNVMSLLYGNNFANQTSFPSGSTYSFASLFNGNTNLVSAENLILPATTLVNNCYQVMFQGCSSLTTAPELPATTLAERCYVSMFKDCTSLTTSPELPATTLSNYSYSQMFRGCTNLNSIKMLATDISGTNCLTNWVQNVSATGTFTKDSSMTTLPTGTNGIPTNWTVVDAS